MPDAPSSFLLTIVAYAAICYQWKIQRLRVRQAGDKRTADNCPPAPCGGGLDRKSVSPHTSNPDGDNNGTRVYSVLVVRVA
jgi:hypothetical protein